MYRGKDDKKDLSSSTRNQLVNYASVFISEFWQTWNWPKKYFEVDIYLHSDVVWMNFKITNENHKEKINFIDDKEKIADIFNILIWEERVRDVYITKDIRWFHKNSFYIVKLNQYKNWDKAVAYQDMSDFFHAIMKSWIKKINNKT